MSQPSQAAPPTRPTILWDFDGTLAKRRGTWSDALVEAVRIVDPENGLRAEALRPLLASGLPWHTPQVAHLHLSVASDWWRHLQERLQDALQQVGVAPAIAAKAVRELPTHYIDPAMWETYPDTIPALQRLVNDGWNHAIISNHVPELPWLVEQLGLARWIGFVVNSAEVGYEKPHPEIFEIACRRAREDRVAHAMVGDNYEADVLGARRAGLVSIHLARDIDRALPDSIGSLTELSGVLEGRRRRACN